MCQLWYIKRHNPNLVTPSHPTTYTIIPYVEYVLQLQSAPKDNNSGGRMISTASSLFFLLLLGIFFVACLNYNTMHTILQPKMTRRKKVKILGRKYTVYSSMYYVLHSKMPCATPVTPLLTYRQSYTFQVL